MPKLSITSTEQLITRYPWYNLGYIDVFEHICKMDKESLGVYLEKAATRVYSRETLYNIYNRLQETNQPEPETIIEEGVSFELEETLELVADGTSREQEVSVGSGSPGEPQSESATRAAQEPVEYTDFVPDTTPRYILAGGDYFSSQDFEQVQLDKNKPLDNFIAEKPSLIRSSIAGKSSLQPIVQNEIDTTELFDDASFYTETLASIYVEQGFYKRALDIYAKLILLYPEKSSYFATLVKGIKEKYNQ